MAPFFEGEVDLSLSCLVPKIIWAKICNGLKQNQHKMQDLNRFCMIFISSFTNIDLVDSFFLLQIFLTPFFWMSTSPVETFFIVDQTPVPNNPRQRPPGNTLCNQITYISESEHRSLWQRQMGVKHKYWHKVNIDLWYWAIWGFMDLLQQYWPRLCLSKYCFTSRNVANNMWEKLNTPLGSEWVNITEIFATQNILH